MNKTYLIDSENINDVWVELLEILGDEDEILVFYTDKSAHMGYDRIVRLMGQKRGIVRWIKCFEGQNALDFQLVTELGSCLSQDGERDYVIVSNDTGYDAVVRYWLQKGCRVSRLKGTECENLRAAAEKAAAAEAKKAAAEAKRAAAEAKKAAAEAKKTEEDAKAAAETKKASAEEKKTVRPKKERMVQMETPYEFLVSRPEIEVAEPYVAEEEEDAVEADMNGVYADGADSEDSVSAEAAAEEAYTVDYETADEPVSWRDQLRRIFAESGSENPEKDLGFLTELCRTIKLSNMSLVHNVLEYHFGQETGNGVYRFIKENPGCRGELSAGYSNNKKQRERQYLELVLDRSGMAVQDGDCDVILKILNGIPRKNLNSIHTALIRKFGQEEGGSFYGVIRNHVKIIRGL